ncbi:MAG: glycerol kinase [Flavobacteriales bacterium]|nr:glycerol kinase [Flavobacteriales bacterium]MBK9540061.1 glycerol kinase [Flavobacteriales bacterium]
MEYLSTSSLANEMDIPGKELFDKLHGLGLITRNGDKWVLTTMGRNKGGQTRTNPKFGEYIVWPEDIDFEERSSRGKYLNATAIGKEFGISPHRMNPIMAELGWLEKNVSGWTITKLGQTIGGRQMEHESGSTYAVWPASILQNKRLLDVVRPSVEPVKPEPNGTSLAGPGFREKFEAKLRTTDGHYVRSRSELVIDNWLYTYGIVHAYERQLNIAEECYCDFYIPPVAGRQAVYIEYWGMEDDPKYADRKKKKLELYRKNEIPLIELAGDDINNLDDVLARKLLKYNIKVG